MYHLNAIWIDKYTRVTFIRSDPTGFITQDEWHVDFCEYPPNYKPNTIDPREVYLTIRVRETEHGWSTVDICTPEQGLRALQAVEVAEMKNDEQEVEARNALTKVMAGLGLAAPIIAGMAA